MNSHSKSLPKGSLLEDQIIALKMLGTEIIEEVLTAGVEVY